MNENSEAQKLIYSMPSFMLEKKAYKEMYSDLFICAKKIQN